MTSDKQALKEIFERQIKKPEHVFWNEISEVYDSAYPHHKIAERYERDYRVWLLAFDTWQSHQAQGEPIAVLCREVYRDHPEMNTDWHDHQPLEPGSKKHVARLESENWELKPVFGDLPASILAPEPVESWRDLGLGEEICVGDRFMSADGEWVEVKAAHLEFTNRVGPATRPHQRKFRAFAPIAVTESRATPNSKQTGECR